MVRVAPEPSTFLPGAAGSGGASLPVGCPIQNLAHLNVCPSAAVSGRNLASVKLSGDGIAACVAGGLNLVNDRQDVGRKSRCIGHMGGAHSLHRASGVGGAQLRSASLGGRQGRLGPLRNGFPLVLGNGGEDVDRELVREGHVGGDELHARLHQLRGEGDVAGEPVELGDDQLGPELLAGGERGGELRPVAALAGLDLDELVRERPFPAVEVVGDGLALRLQPEPGRALLVGRDPQI
jgi:hypothetical protein